MQTLSTSESVNEGYIGRVRLVRENSMDRGVSPVVAEFNGQKHKGVCARVYPTSSEYNGMPKDAMVPAPRPANGANPNLLFCIHYEDGDWEDVDLTRFVQLFKAADHQSEILNKHGELKLFEVKYIGCATFNS